MKCLSCAALLLAAAMLVAAAGPPVEDRTLTAHIHVVDVGLGNAAFVVAPTGEVMLLDTGPARAADRILKFMSQNGIRQIDYLVASHFEEDHIGTVDAYLVTHHAQSMPREMGDYYPGLSGCPPAEVRGLNPRAAILSLGALGHKNGAPDAMKTLRGVPGMDLWQTEFIREGGEKDYNAPEQFIANLGRMGDKVPYIGLTARADGSFTVTNSRNGYAKNYPAK